MYAISGFKTFKGHEGEPCGQGNITKSGKKVAEWSDDSWGGPMRIDFKDKAEGASFVQWAKGYLSKQKDYDGKEYDADSMSEWAIQESAVFHMSTEYEERKTLEKAAKKGIVAKVRENGIVETYTYKMAYTATNVAKLRAKHGADLVEVVNERLGMELVDDEVAKLKAENDYYKKVCKSSIVFKVKKDDGSIAVMQTKVIYSPSAAKMVRERNPNIIEIINERFI